MRVAYKSVNSTQMKKLLFTLILLLSVIAGRSQCDASFFDTIYYDTLTIINTSDTGAGITYYWYFPGGIPSSDTTTDVNEWVSVYYDSAGTYTVCLVLVNTTSSCVDTFCNVNTLGGGPLNTNATASATTCGQCNGSASANASGGIPPYTYLWSNAATTANIANLCAGTYTVTVTDNNSNIITDVVFVAPSGSSSLSAYITLSDSTPCTNDSVIATAVPVGGVGPYDYDWSTGSSGSSIQIETSGLYTVTITDSNGCSGVSDSIYLAFQVSPIITMNDTDETCASCCNGTAFASVTGGSGGYDYLWSDASTSPYITGLCQGVYTVTVTDSLTGCYDYAIAHIDSFSCKVLSGFLTQGSHSRIYLIEENAGVLTAIDSFDIDTAAAGWWAFENICPGTYYVKGALLPAHSQYSSYVPTYYSSAALWSNATAIVMTSNHITNVNFGLISGTNPGGPGFIGGLISQGANRAEGDPLSGVQVIVYNDADQVVAFAKTDAEGQYEIDNLALGNYKVHVDILNRTSYHYEAILTSEHPEANNINFIVTGSVIKPQFPTGIADAVSENLFVYPNPANGMIHISQGTLQVRSVKVYDLLGSRVFEQNIVTGDKIINLGLEFLSSGTYMLELNGDGFSHRQPVVLN